MQGALSVTSCQVSRLSPEHESRCWFRVDHLAEAASVRLSLLFCPASSWEEAEGVCPCDCARGSGFPDLTPAAQTPKGKTGESDVVKTKDFRASEDAVREAERERFLQTTRPRRDVCPTRVRSGHDAAERQPRCAGRRARADTSSGGLQTAVRRSRCGVARQGGTSPDAGRGPPSTEWGGREQREGQRRVLAQGRTVGPSLLRRRRRQSRTAAAEDGRPLAAPHAGAQTRRLVPQAARLREAPAGGLVRPRPGCARSGGCTRQPDSVAVCFLLGVEAGSLPAVPASRRVPGPAHALLCGSVVLPGKTSAGCFPFVFPVFRFGGFDLFPIPWSPGPPGGG